MNKNILTKILKENAFCASIKTINLLKGGANNRVYKIDFEDENNSIILKSYFSHPNDKRNRLNAEFSFLSFLWNNNISCIPQPITKIDKTNIGIYSYIEGKPFEQKNLSEIYIQKAIDFYLTINSKKENAKNIENASEACFTYNDYTDSINKRLKNLLKASTFVHKNSRVLNLINNDLQQLWQKIKDKSEKYKSDFNLSKNDYGLSPSDFGFHNVLIDNKNNLYFIDFEYAGWDDPAKTICDFFTQPKINIPDKYLNINLPKIANVLCSSKDFIKRVNVVFPISQIKWCCIILNSFLMINSKRRSFANAKEKINEQIEKASNLLKKIKI